MIVLRGQLTRFVVVFPGRVGSTYLASGLNSHPRIRAEGEELVPLKDDGADAQLAFTRRFLRGPLVGRNQVVGFRAKYYDVLDAAGFGEILQELGVRIILMNRRNVVKTAISHFTGDRLRQQTGQWNRYDGAAADPITISLDDLDQMLRGVEDQHKQVVDFIEPLDLPTTHIDYEDLLTSPGEVFAGALEFLGLPPAEVKPQTRKNTSDDLREAVANFDELRAHCEGTRYVSMFDEVLIP